jgi:chaperonin GroES
MPIEAEPEETLMAKKAAKKQGMRLIPLGDRVVLKRKAPEERTAGGIVLPDAAQDRPQQGEVVSIGEGHIRNDGTRVPLSVKEGDRVIFSSYAGEEITVGDEEYLLLRESDILAVF